MWFFRNVFKVKSIMKNMKKWLKYGMYADLIGIAISILMTYKDMNFGVLGAVILFPILIIPLFILGAFVGGFIENIKNSKFHLWWSVTSLIILVSFFVFNLMGIMERNYPTTNFLRDLFRSPDTFFMQLILIFAILIFIISTISFILNKIKPKNKQTGDCLV